MAAYPKGPGPLLISNSQVHFLSLTNFLNDLCNTAVLNTNLNTLPPGCTNTWDQQVTVPERCSLTFLPHLESKSKTQMIVGGHWESIG
ncbi:mCG1050922 [Mus musculus]|nr:mCG1050922 [Mus musculus]